MVHHGYLGVPLKPERIVIRCYMKTKIQFREFTAKYKDQEAALKALLDLAKGKAYSLRR